jgi:hypothetical protein
VSATTSNRSYVDARDTNEKIPQIIIPQCRTVATLNLERASLSHSVAAAELDLRGSEFQFSQRLFVGSVQGSAFGDDGGDLLCRGHVEGWVFDADFLGSELLCGVVR